MDTISISALASIPEPSQGQANVTPLAQNSNGLNFGAVLAASNQSTNEEGLGGRTQTSATNATQNVNNLTVPPKVIVEAVVAAINNAISLAAIKSATEALAVPADKATESAGAWTTTTSEDSNLDLKLDSVSEPVEVIISVYSDTHMLSQTPTTGDEHAPGASIKKIVEPSERDQSTIALSFSETKQTRLQIDRNAAQSMLTSFHDKPVPNSNTHQNVSHKRETPLGDQPSDGSDPNEATKISVVNTIREAELINDPREQTRMASISSDLVTLTATPPETTSISTNAHHATTFRSTKDYEIIDNASDLMSDPRLVVMTSLAQKNELVATQNDTSNIGRFQNSKVTAESDEISSKVPGAQKLDNQTVEASYLIEDTLDENEDRTAETSIVRQMNVAFINATDSDPKSISAISAIQTDQNSQVGTKGDHKDKLASNTQENDPSRYTDKAPLASNEYRKSETSLIRPIIETLRKATDNVVKIVGATTESSTDQTSEVEINTDRRHDLDFSSEHRRRMPTPESVSLSQPQASSISPEIDPQVIIRASLEKVAIVTQTLAKISQEIKAQPIAHEAEKRMIVVELAQTTNAFVPDRLASGKPPRTLQDSETQKTSSASSANALTNEEKDNRPDLITPRPLHILGRLPLAADLIVSATAYVDPTEMELENEQRQNESQTSKITVLHEMLRKGEAAEALASPKEPLMKAKSDDGKTLPDTKPSAQTVAPYLNAENTANKIEQNSAPQATKLQEATINVPTETRDWRPRQISEDLRLRALERQVVTAAREGANQIRMQLYPPGIGQVLIKLALDGTKLRLQFKTSSSDATASLIDVEDALRQALNESGFTITSFDVSDEDNDARDERRRERNSVVQAPPQQGTSTFSVELQA